MKIEKLPSGSFRIRKTYKGHTFTVICPYKPTQKEALQLIAEKMEEPLTAQTAPSGCLNDFIDNFIALIETQGKSPATVRGYLSIQRNLSKAFTSIRLSELTNDDLQREINRYSEGRSPKSVRNMYGLVKAVLDEYRPSFALSVNLPAKEIKAEYEPSTRDVQRILEASKGTRYEIVLHLCVLGLRRGEAIAVTPADIDENNVLTIDKDIILNKENKYVLKDKPKTEYSYRRILLPRSIADQIRAQGYVYKGDPHSINKYLHTFQDKLGIPRFRLHMLRHFCVAYLHREGFTDQQIMTFGGWANSSDVMKRAYRYNLDPEESQKSITAKIDDLFS